MKYLLLFLFLFSVTASARISGWQNSDSKTPAECIAAGSTPSACLLGDGNIWDSVNGQLLSATIAGIAPAGGTGYNVSTITASASLVAGSPLNQQHVACDSTLGNVVASLPACVSGTVGQYFNLKKIDSSSNSCGYLASGSDLIDGQTSLSTTNQYVGFAVVCRTAGFWDIL
jgi:hypothetical protein